jgi:hypothetical protein
MASTQDLATYRYELSNHLGNTLTTFTGRKLGQGTIGNEVSHYEPEIVSLGDYDPFGVELYGRSYNNAAIMELLATDMGLMLRNSTKVASGAL